MMLARCVSAVLTLIPRATATSLLLLPFGEQLYNFALAGRKPVSQLRFGNGHGILIRETAQEHFRSARGEKCTVIRHRFDGAHQIPIRVGLHDVGPGASLDDVSNKLVRKMKCQDHNPYFRKGFMDSATRLETIQIGHADIHDYDFGLELFSERNRLPSRFSLPTHFPSGPRREQLF